MGNLTTERKEVQCSNLYSFFRRALLNCNNTSPLYLRQKTAVLLKFMATEWLKTQRGNSVKELAIAREASKTNINSSNSSKKKQKTKKQKKPLNCICLKKIPRSPVENNWKAERIQQQCQLLPIAET